MTWSEVELGDCLQLASGGTPSKMDAQLWVGDIPWVSCKDMKTLRLHDTQDHVSCKAVGKGTRLVPAGTILIVVRGMILAKDFPVAEAQRPLTFNQDLKAVTARPNADARFLLYWFLAHRHLLMSACDEAAHGTKRLQTDRLLSMPVRLPPLIVQRRIASILSTYDDLIENNARRIDILEEMAKRIYEEWFVRYRFPGHEGVRMVESELGLVPEGWTVVAASKAIEINPTTRVPREGLKTFLAMNCLSDASMLIDAAGQREGNSGSKFRNGDTLFARITPCLENGKTGFVQFLPSDEDTAFGSTEFIVLRSRTLTPEFVYLLARSDAFRDHAIKSMSGASGRQRVRESCFDAFLLANPDGDTLAEFAAVVRPMFALVQVLAQKNLNLRATRDLLLPKLISGDLDVSALPEPESVAA